MWVVTEGEGGGGGGGGGARTCTCKCKFVQSVKCALSTIMMCECEA